MEKVVPESKMGQGNQKGHRNGLRKRETTILRAQLRQQDICKRLQQTIAIPIVRVNRTRFSQHGLHVWPYRPHEVLVIVTRFFIGPNLLFYKTLAGQTLPCYRSLDNEIAFPNHFRTPIFHNLY